MWYRCRTLYNFFSVCSTSSLHQTCFSVPPSSSISTRDNIDARETREYSQRRDKVEEIRTHTLFFVLVSVCTCSFLGIVHGSSLSGSETKHRFTDPWSASLNPDRGAFGPMEARCGDTQPRFRLHSKRSLVDPNESSIRLRDLWNALCCFSA